MITAPQSRSASFATIAALVIVMIGTRADHFGQFIDLRDASLAVFFLAGLLRPARSLFAALLVVAFGVDFVEFAQAGVLSSCYTPAYAFLVPTYACLWVAGERSRAALDASSSSGAHRDYTAVLGGVAVRLVMGAALAFAISNLSYFAFSGQFAHLTLFDYVAATARYATPYVGHAVGYAVLGVALLALFTRVPAMRRNSA